MGPLKAPGIDGYPVVFFHKNWDIVGDKLCDFMLATWKNLNQIHLVNQTLLVLIPKVTKPQFVNQFQSIALCNMVNKTLAKVVVNCLKPLMDKLISPFQTSFLREIFSITLL